jgi:hypothetical protein
MRKTSDLVNEMLTEAKDAWLVAIVIGFEKEPAFVFNSQKHPVERLNAHVKNGGAPLGLLRFDKENGVVQGSYRPFLEYETEAWVGEYLAGLLDHAGEIIAMSREIPVFPNAY